MRSKWQAVQTMSWTERKILFLAAIALPVIAAWLRLASLASVQATLARTFRPNSPAPTSGDGINRIVAKVTASHPYEANCLERSLILWWLFGRSGIPSEIRFGVRPNPEGDSPEFHSWVEVEGVVVNDRPDIAGEFIPFDQSIGPGPGNLV